MHCLANFIEFPTVDVNRITLPTAGQFNLSPQRKRAKLDTLRN
jgi:hypothetical protein